MKCIKVTLPNFGMLQAGAAKNLILVSHGVLLNNRGKRRVDSSVVPPSE